jgi:uncharacterized protein YkwD
MLRLPPGLHLRHLIGRRAHRMGGRAHARSVLLLVVGSVLGGSALAPVTAEAQDARDRDFLALINAEREKARLTPLRFHGAARRWARNWTPHMIEAGRPSHQNLSGLLVSPITKVGENVGVSTEGVVKIFEGFMESDSHRANIMDPSFTHVGIATMDGPFRGSDAVWTTHVFVRVPARE